VIRTFTVTVFEEANGYPLELLPSVKKSVVFIDMTTIADRVREYVNALPTRSFLWSTDVPGPSAAVAAELTRLVRKRQLRRVRNGLYWKGPMTELGIAAPEPEDVALEVAGRGAGPAGVAAAHWLGLTTQVPGTPEIAVPGSLPTGVDGVRFTSRPYIRRELGLTPTEVALIEVLRIWPIASETTWEEMRDRVAELISGGSLRAEKVDAAVNQEHRRGQRSNWESLRGQLAMAVAN
jgi:hypothetical protein